MSAVLDLVVSVLQESEGLLMGIWAVTLLVAMALCDVAGLSQLSYRKLCQVLLVDG